MKDDMIMVRRRKVVTHDPGTVLATIKVGDFLAFGIARKNKKDPFDKALGREIAKERAIRAKNNLLNDKGDRWVCGKKIPLKGALNVKDLRAFLREFNAKNFV